VTYGGGSTAERKLVGEQSGRDRAVIEWRVRVGDDPPIHHGSLGAGAGGVRTDDVIGLVKYVREHEAEEQAA
jgi:hypothetical protein